MKDQERGTNTGEKKAGGTALPAAKQNMVFGSWYESEAAGANSGSNKES